MNTDMKKQTAVQLLKESIDHELKLGTKMVVNWDMYLAMEKQQILDAHWDGSIYWDSEKTEEQYYTKTYGGDK
jgi:hypothetical protein